MKNLLFLGLILAVTVFSTNLFAGFEGQNDGASLKIFNRINCSTGLACSRGANGLFVMTADGATAGDLVGEGLYTAYGFLSEYSDSSTSETIAAADCMKTYHGSSTTTISLPEASTVIGCRYTFINAGTTAMLVNPDDADMILVETNTVGDSISNGTIGNSIVLEAISATYWAVVSVIGTWNDAD